MRAITFVAVLSLFTIVCSQAVASPADSPSLEGQRLKSFSLADMFLQEGQQRTKPEAEQPSLPQEKPESMRRYRAYEKPWYQRTYDPKQFQTPSLSLFLAWHHAPDADHFYAFDSIEGMKDVDGNVIVDFEVQFSYMLEERLGVDASFGFLNGPDHGLHGTLTALDIRYDLPSRTKRTFPYAKAGILYGSMGWDEAGTFNSAMGFELGVGFFLGGEDAVFTFEVLFRNIMFDYDGKATTVAHSSAIKLTGVSFKFGMRVFLF